jgi:hypothetical protein
MALMRGLDKVLVVPNSCTKFTSEESSKFFIPKSVARFIAKALAEPVAAAGVVKSLLRFKLLLAMLIVGSKNCMNYLKAFHFLSDWFWIKDKDPSIIKIMIEILRYYLIQAMDYYENNDHTDDDSVSCFCFDPNQHHQHHQCQQLIKMHNKHLIRTLHMTITL